MVDERFRPKKIERSKLSDDDVIFAEYDDKPLFGDDEDEQVSPVITVTHGEQAAVFAPAEETEGEAVAEGQTCLKGKIEAVLFITGKPLTASEIAEIVGAPVAETEDALIELIQDFGFREHTSLEIDDTDGYIMQVKEDYSDIVNKMMPLEISAAELRTLSAIALKGPVLQSDLVELRGAIIYEHIPTLLTRKLVSKKREGRSFVLNVTKNFYEYFKLLGDKKQLKGLVEKLGREPSRRKLLAGDADLIDEISGEVPDEATDIPLEEAAS